MRPIARPFMILGALLAGLSVAAGAFGAHTLQGFLEPRQLQTFETAARYQMYHAIALLFVAFALETGRGRGRTLQLAGWCFAGGVLLFSGSLYALVFTGLGVFGPITPLGGGLFLAGWTLFLLWALRR